MDIAKYKSLIKYIQDNCADWTSIGKIANDLNEDHRQIRVVLAQMKKDDRIEYINLENGLHIKCKEPFVPEVSKGFSGNIIGNGFQGNRIGVPFTKNTIADNFKNNDIVGDNSSAGKSWLNKWWWSFFIPLIVGLRGSIAWHINKLDYNY